VRQRAQQLGFGLDHPAGLPAALEYAARGVRINAVFPGTIDTPMVADILAKPSEFLRTKLAHLRCKLIAH
jgi:NAD(P)-dependent dehydrogenase (short-subunit alcohol dehydrogenase family)